MKFSYLALVGFLVMGCSSLTKKPSSGQAGALAQRIANEKAAELYGAKPFVNDAPARFINGEWVWQARRGFGSGDIETMVRLAPNGEARSVDVILLDNRPILF